jgi:ATP-binding cassette subfamily B protein
MKALFTLNRFFWKYRYRMLLGLVFIVLTNIFAVYSPTLIEEGIGVLGEAQKTYFDAIDFTEDGPNIPDGLFEQPSPELPTSIQFLADLTGASTAFSKGIDSYDRLGNFLVRVGLLLAVLYIIVYLIKGVFLFFTRQTIIVMSRLIEYDQKNEIYAHYQKLSMAFYRRNNTGDLMNRISEDVSKVRMYLGPAVMYSLNLVVLVVMVVGKMFMVDPELSLYALSPLPFMSVAIYYISNSINKRSEAVQRQQSALSSLVQDSISGIRVIKSYNRETQREAQFTSESDNYKTTALSLVKVDALFMPIITLLVGLSTVLTIYIGGIKVNAGELEVKQIFTFVFYVNMLTWPFASVGWVSSLVQKAEASQERINAFLNEEPEIQNPNDAALKVDGKIEFKDVSFTYPESGVKALKNLSFTIEPGETLAVTGRTGSGKSTLANLLLRHYDAASGQILIDGKPINTLNLNALRKQIGYVPQEVFLFSDSIRNNIGFGMDGLGDNFDQTVTSAALDAGVHDNIVDFPKGYETKLGERGLNLSGGQKQRISIARAIIKDPAILIFDDCLSAVDTQTEELILGNLRKLMQGKSSIIISHRISTIKHADKIIVLDQGSIVEAGTHAELLANGGMYARIYRKQLLEASTEQA